MQFVPKIHDSGIDMTDVFCGAGGSTTGAKTSGIQVRMAINHWDLAVETHNTNHPETDHDCRDVQACDPRRYPSTRIGWFSPECTNHSLAKGKKRSNQGQGDFFKSSAPDPSEERSRATMWDVVRFTEYHRYDVVIVENVIDAGRWALWNAWLKAMQDMGYRHKAVYMNSMFCHPTPQSRDRLYVVFWKKGNVAPDLDIRPRAHCPRCERDIEARQAWRDTKYGRMGWGAYGRQYDYVCPVCVSIVQPYYYAALNAIDFSIPAERIGDRTRPLKDRTRERIRYGLERFGDEYLIVTAGSRSTGPIPGTDPAPTQTGSERFALVSPFFVETAFSHAPISRVRHSSEPLNTQTARPSLGMVMPMLTSVNDFDNVIRPATDVFGTQTTQGKYGVTLSPAFIATLRRSHNGSGLDEPLDTFCAGGTHHALVIKGAALLSMRNSQGGYLLRGLGDPLGVQVATCTQDFIISRAPFLVPYYGQSDPAGSGDALPTVTTVDRCGLVQPEINVDDCYFRMLQSHEIRAAMAFPDDYVILGTKREQVKQLGNAVTPPAAAVLVERCVETLN